MERTDIFVDKSEVLNITFRMTELPLFLSPTTYIVQGSRYFQGRHETTKMHALLHAPAALSQIMNVLRTVS